MSSNLNPISWGIIGGMGPLASAEFVRTIYEMSAGRAEQTAPRLFLLSDPSFPDRTDALETGARSLLRARLSVAISQVLQQGVSAVVICCVTIHAVLDDLPEELRSLVVPLTDVILRGASEGDGRRLLLCTKGSRESNLFQQHPLWPQVSRRIVFPSHDDLQAVHELIYSIKRNRWNPREAATFIRVLICKYECSSAIAGCTELHIVLKRSLEMGDRLPLFDPLMELAALISATRFTLRKEEENVRYCRHF